MAAEAKRCDLRAAAGVCVCFVLKRISKVRFVGTVAVLETTSGGAHWGVFGGPLTAGPGAGQLRDQSAL